MRKINLESIQIESSLSLFFITIEDFFGKPLMSLWLKWKKKKTTHCFMTTLTLLIIIINFSEWISPANIKYITLEHLLLASAYSFFRWLQDTKPKYLHLQHPWICDLSGKPWSPFLRFMYHRTKMNLDDL